MKYLYYPLDPFYNYLLSFIIRPIPHTCQVVVVSWHGMSGLCHLCSLYLVHYGYESFGYLCYQSNTALGQLGQCQITQIHHLMYSLLDLCLIGLEGQGGQDPTYWCHLKPPVLCH